MLNQIVTSGLAPLYKNLNVKLTKQGVTPPLLRLARAGTGLLAIILFGLQYLGLAVAIFLLHKLIAGLTSAAEPQEKNHAGHYLVAATALLAATWTASDSGLPVAFLFWTVLVNIITEQSRPANALRLADSGELSLICVLLALVPGYLPAVAIMGGVLFTISSAWNSLPSIRRLMGHSE